MDDKYPGGGVLPIMAYGGGGAPPERGTFL